MSLKSWWAQTVHNKLIALILAMVVIVPLIATPADSRFRGVAALGFEGLGIVLLATLLWRADWTLTKSGLRQFLTAGANLPILLFMGLSALSCALSPHRQYSEQELLRVGTGILLYFAVAAHFRRSEQLARLVDALVFVTIGAGLIGLVQYGSSHAAHATGLFSDHQLYGSFLMILLPLVGIMAVTEPNPNRQLLAQIATVLTATCLLLSQARSAWVGAAAGLALLGLLAFTAAQRGDRNGRRSLPQIALPLIMLVMALGFFLLIFPQTSALVGRATSLQHTNTVNTWQIRQHTWHGAEQMIAARPLTGFGLGLYPYYQKEYTRDGMPISVIGGAPSLGEQAHNFYLQTAAELGLPGLLLMVAALVTFLVSGFVRLGDMEAGIRRSLLMGSMAGVVAFAADAFASPSWQCGQVSMFLWLTLGLGAACMRPQASGRKERTAVNMADLRAASRPAYAPPAPPRWSPRLTRPAGILAALVLALLLPSVVYAVDDLYATPVSLLITPANTSIRGGGAQRYTVLVTFSDKQILDVTLNAESGLGSSRTTITQTGGKGFMTGPNNRVYQSKAREVDVVTINANFTQTADPQFTNPSQKSGTVNSSVRLAVHFP